MDMSNKKMKNKDMEKIACKIAEKFMNEQQRLENENKHAVISQENYLQTVCDDETAPATDVERARKFFERNEKECEYTDDAFKNLVNRVNQLEREVKKKNDKIIELKDDVQKLKEKDKCKYKKMAGELDEIRGEIKQLDGNIGWLSGRIKDIMSCIKSIGIIGDLLDDSVKNKNMKRELNKQADKRRRENKKYRQMQMKTEKLLQKKGGY